MSLIPLAALEGALRFFDGDGSTTPAEVTIAAGDPLFALDQSQARYITSPSRREYFAVQSFSAEKPDGTFRIFCVGGSMVQGRPYAPDTAFSTWLRITLEAMARRRRFEVVNCGGVSYASYRLAPVVDELLRYDPDLIILCTGHNEFIEDRAIGGQRPSSAIQRALLRLKMYSLLRQSVDRLLAEPEEETVNKVRLPAEVDALLDHRGGLERYRRDDARRRLVVASYRANLRRMIETCQEAGMPLLLVNPPSNIRDCPPFKHGASLRAGSPEAKRFEALWEQARPLWSAQPDKAAELLSEAIELDDRNAAAHYLLGKCLEAAGDFASAKASYLRAKEEDLCPLRMLEPMHQAVLRQRGAKGLLDARKMFEQQSPHGLIGDDTMVDHVHPHIRGHQWIAEALAKDIMNDIIGAKPKDDWQAVQEKKYREHLSALNAAYYERGRQRLEGLRLWTQGRARVMNSD